MIRWNKWLSVLVVALWLPLSCHCRLETIPGLQFLAFCDHTDEAPQPDDDCTADGCAVIESGHYRSDDNAPMVVAANLILAAFLSVFTDERSHSSAAIRQVGPSGAPPEIQRTWQFAQRAAWPVRAPSLAS